MSQASKFPSMMHVRNLQTDEMEAAAADCHRLLTTDILELAFATMDHEPQGGSDDRQAHLQEAHERDLSRGLLRKAQTLRRCSEDWRAAKECPTEADCLQCLEKARQKCAGRPHDVCLPQEHCGHWWT